MTQDSKEHLKARLTAINPFQLLAELVIVFLGVYLAFSLSSQQEVRRYGAQQEKVIALLDLGFERYQSLFSGFAQRHENRNPVFKATLEENEVPYFGGEYFTAPQYPIDAITFLLTDKSYELFDNGLYVPLTSYLNAIKRLMYVEEKLVELSETYQPLPSSSHPDYERLHRVEYHKAQRFYNYLELRRNISEELGENAEQMRTLLKQGGGD